MRGNTGVLKCLVPSFVADFVEVLEWVSDDNESYSTALSNEVANYGIAFLTKVGMDAVIKNPKNLTSQTQKCNNPFFTLQCFS